ncbi:uncharacterized protein TNCV_4716021 [Trichonephila clavipes]|nr:uncharacterized protein TNCV_4716021 [Trichonephila clavipes]
MGMLLRHSMGMLITAKINTDCVNHPVPSTTKPSTNVVRVVTDACESIINFILRYKDYDSHKNAHKNFQKRFLDNPFGQGCSICNRLWFRDDLITPVAAEHKHFLPGINLGYIKACYNCLQSLSQKSIPNLSKYDGFVYLEVSAHLSTLDLVSERLISPRIPFMQIRRSRHLHGQFGILGQIMKVPTRDCNIGLKVQYWPRLHGRKLPAICRNESALYPFTRRTGILPGRNADLNKWAETIQLERRQTKSVGRWNSRSIFLRSDWPRPFARREVGVEMDWVDPKINDPRQGDLE